jgi:hypothetical protein
MMFWKAGKPLRSSPIASFFASPLLMEVRHGRILDRVKFGQMKTRGGRQPFQLLAARYSACRYSLMTAPVGSFSADVDGLSRKYPTWEPESSMINLGSDVRKPLRQSHSPAIGKTGCLGRTRKRDLF